MKSIFLAIIGLVAAACCADVHELKFGNSPDISKISELRDRILNGDRVRAQASDLVTGVRFQLYVNQAVTNGVANPASVAADGTEGRPFYSIGQALDLLNSFGSNRSEYPCINVAPGVYDLPPWFCTTSSAPFTVCFKAINGPSNTVLDLSKTVNGQRQGLYGVVHPSLTIDVNYVEGFTIRNPLIGDYSRPIPHQFTYLGMFFHQCVFEPCWGKVAGNAQLFSNCYIQECDVKKATICSTALYANPVDCAISGAAVYDSVIRLATHDDIGEWAAHGVSVGSPLDLLAPSVLSSTHVEESYVEAFGDSFRSLFYKCAGKYIDNSVFLIDKCWWLVHDTSEDYSSTTRNVVGYGFNTSGRVGNLNDTKMLTSAGNYVHQIAYTLPMVHTNAEDGVVGTIKTQYPSAVRSAFGRYSGEFATAFSAGINTNVVNVNFGTLKSTSNVVYRVNLEPLMDEISKRAETDAVLRMIGDRLPEYNAPIPGFIGYGIMSYLAENAYNDDAGLRINATYAKKSEVNTELAKKVNSATLTNTVNEVKGKFWDAPLSVTWKVDVTGGDMHFAPVTNVNTEVLGP